MVAKFNSYIASNFAFYDTSIEFLSQNFFELILALFANFIDKIGRKGTKNEKRKNVP
jgi:hypothetical protein